jgi:flagellar export protein FliJ
MSRRFRFRLETLLRHRADLEETERTRLSRIQLRYAAKLEQLAGLEAKLAGTLAELAERCATPADRREMTWYYRFMDRLKAEIASSRKQIEQIEAEMEKQRTAVIEASRNTKVLDSLRGRMERQFTLAEERAEQKALDDIVVTRFATKK